MTGYCRSIITNQSKYLQSKSKSFTIKPFGLTKRIYQMISKISTAEASADDLQPKSSSIIDNALAISNRIKIAALNSNRDPTKIQLVAVSKTKPSQDILELYKAGYRHFGENYFQELMEKSTVLPQDIEWHFIGHLQSSKASKLLKEVPNLFVVETVDSEKLASKLNTACESVGDKILNIYLQVNTSQEDSKSGVDEELLVSLIQFIQNKCGRLRIKGLMTIGAPGDSTCFDKLVHLSNVAANAMNVSADQLQLSMGMSDDFEEAIARGSTSIRVGSSIFGARQTQLK